MCCLTYVVRAAHALHHKHADCEPSFSWRLIIISQDALNSPLYRYLPQLVGLHGQAAMLVAGAPLEAHARVHMDGCVRSTEPMAHCLSWMLQKASELIRAPLAQSAGAA